LHSPYPYLALLLLGLLLPIRVHGFSIGHVVAGIGLGGIVHLAVDILSPSGIPLGNPFGARSSFGPNISGGQFRYLYRTGTPEEWPVLLPFVLMLAVEAIIVIAILHDGFPTPISLLHAITTG
jgi:hypothetical protein